MLDQHKRQGHCGASGGGGKAGAGRGSFTGEQLCGRLCLSEREKKYLTCIYFFICLLVYFSFFYFFLTFFILSCLLAELLHSITLTGAGVGLCV